MSPLNSFLPSSDNNGNLPNPPSPQRPTYFDIVLNSNESATPSVAEADKPHPLVPPTTSPAHSQPTTRQPCRRHTTKREHDPTRCRDKGCALSVPEQVAGNIRCARCLASPLSGSEKRIARRAAGDMCTTLGCVLSAAEQADGFATCAACRAMKDRGRMRQRGLYAAQGRCRTRGCPLGPEDRGYVQCASCREVGMERLRMWKKVGKMRSGVGGAASS